MLSWILLTESDATGWTKSFHVDIRFASGIEGLEAARTKVYKGSHWASFKAATNDFINEYQNDSRKVEGWDDTFSYEALDSFSDHLATHDELDQMEGQLQALLEAMKTLQQARRQKNMIIGQRDRKEVKHFSMQQYSDLIIREMGTVIG